MDRTVSVPRQRLERWLAGFAERHGSTDLAADPAKLTLSAADGAIAEIEVPFPPLAEPSLTGLLDHIARDRMVGVLLVRKAGHAVGVFHGAELRASKVGHRYVQGRTKAGGWSQQRYARRRENQAAKAYAAAAADAAQVLLPALAELEFLACGGESRAVDAVLGDRRLARLAELRAASPWPTLPVADPRLTVLCEFGAGLLSVRIGLNELA